MIWPDYTPQGQPSSARDLLSEIAGVAAARAWNQALVAVQAVLSTSHPAAINAPTFTGPCFACYRHLQSALVIAGDPTKTEQLCLNELNQAIPP